MSRQLLLKGLSQEAAQRRRRFFGEAIEAKAKALAEAEAEKKARRKARAAGAVRPKPGTGQRKLDLWSDWQPKVVTPTEVKVAKETAARAKRAKEGLPILGAMRSGVGQGRLFMVPKAAMLKAGVKAPENHPFGRPLPKQAPKPHVTDDWERDYRLWLARVEEYYGEKGLLRELMWRVSDRRDPFVARMLKVLAKNPGDELRQPLSHDDLQELREKVVQEHMAESVRRWRRMEDHDRRYQFGSQEGVLAFRRAIGLEHTSDEALLTNLLSFVGSCEVSPYEVEFLGQKACWLIFSRLRRRRLRFIGNQRAYAERLLTGDCEDLPRVGFAKRPRELRLGDISAFMASVSERFQMPEAKVRAILFSPKRVALKRGLERGPEKVARQQVLAV